MEVNVDKTKVLLQAPPNQETFPANLNLSGHPLESVDHFSYLGSLLSNDGSCQKDVDNR